MRGISQFAAIIAIAVGAGLFQFGRSLDPALSATGPEAAMRSAGPRDHEMAAFAIGWGVGFMTLGGLILVVPWIEKFVNKHCANAIPGPA
jgi:hypothetical protein